MTIEVSALFVSGITLINGRFHYHFVMMLEIYVREGCWSCAETRRIIADVQQEFPAVPMELRDIDQTEPPEVVFATPTYLLNGRVLFLGNPTRAELRRKLNEKREMERLEIRDSPIRD